MAASTRVYTADDLDQVDYSRDLGDPGEFPYTRGIHRSRLPRQAVDDAPVRRVRHARGNQRAIQSSCCRPAGPD